MNLLSSGNRAALIQKSEQEPYDLLVIGGGITGAGIALDAATRGLRTVLLEKGDFASGTSSRSTKLVHGGLRYLKNFEFGLVREVGRERAVVHRLAPHLVINEKMILPLVRGGTYGRLMTSIGLKVYDLLAGVKRGDRRRMLDKRKTLELEPLIAADQLVGGGIYAEYRTDDARLTLEVIKTAQRESADVLNYARVEDFLMTDDQVGGAIWRDQLSGETHQVHARHVINAAGPWVDELRKADRSLKGKYLRPTKGVHIVVTRERFPIHHTLYFDIPDGRMIFAIPRDRAVYIGTTDTDYLGNLDEVRTELADASYLLDGVNHLFPAARLTLKDIESSWAGLRPLIAEEGKSPSEVSRKDEIFESPSGLLSIAGGKLTGYRKMAERIVDRVADRIRANEGRRPAPCQTHRTRLTGGAFENQAEVERYTEATARTLEELDPSLKARAGYLVHNYGQQTDAIVAGYSSQEGRPEQRLALSELDFTLSHEAVFTLLDFFERRTGRLYFDIHSIAGVRDAVTRRMQEQLNWSDEQTRAQVEQLDQAIHRASHFGEG
ncbi:MAG: glycerol-3-phosphate dehydrogenase/oxidase [Akkermansiaceae bacterium]|nr:glycerol-3-phosphate dehydrogenase/oxidase [Akkermansiaceae bacterium]